MRIQDLVQPGISLFVVEEIDQGLRSDALALPAGSEEKNVLGFIECNIIEL